MNVTNAWAAYCGTDEYKTVSSKLPPTGPDATGALFASFAAGFKAAAEESAVAVEQYDEGFSADEVIEFSATDIRKMAAE